MRSTSFVLAAFALAGIVATSGCNNLPMAGLGGSTASSGILSNASNFITQLDAARGKALTATENSAVMSILTGSSSAASSIQSTFVNNVAVYTGIDPSILSAAFPSATTAVSDSSLTSTLESKLGQKLTSAQNISVKAANALRNNSLDSIKSSLTNSVASKVGVDATTVSSLLPLLGF